jgi:hypothetical protein
LLLEEDLFMSKWSRTSIILAIILALLGVAPAHASTSQNSTDDAVLIGVVQKYLHDRAQRLTASSTIQGQSALTSAPVSSALAERLRADAQAIDDRRTLLRSVNGGHKRAEVSIANAQVVHGDDKAAVALTEHTKLHFARVLSGGPQAEEYQLRHSFELVNKAGHWELADAIPQLSIDGIPPDTYPQTPAPAARPSEAPKGASSVEQPKTAVRVDKLAPGYRSPNNALNYDYEAMITYAYRHWSTYNTDYRTYGGQGGDCTNFISQIMIAGGWETAGAYPVSDRTHPSNWWYNSLGTFATTYTWAAAHNWMQFARTHSGRVAALSHVRDMAIADVLQVDTDSDGNISHSMFVTDVGLGGDGEVDEQYMTYHSNDTKDKPLTSVIAAYPNGTWYAHRT